MVEFIIGGVFILIAIILGTISILIRKKMIGNCSEEIMATITGLVYSRVFNGPKLSYSIYEFDYNGQHYEVHAKTSTGKRRKGVVEKIYIDPSDPTKHYRKSDLWVPNFLILWAVLVLVSILSYLLKTLIFG